MTQQQATRWHSFNSQQEINQTAISRILQAADEAIKIRGKFLIVLAGGSTPKAIYQALSRESADWAHWHVFINDDRCLPPDHDDRNSKMAAEAWLNHVPVPKASIYNIPAELGPVAGAKRYAEMIKDVGTFDLVLFGLGEDGHTASLFPGHAVDNSAVAVPVFDAPKPPAERITMSQNRLNDTREAIFLVTGSGKQWAVDQWRSNSDIPARLIKPVCGVDVYCMGVNLT